MQIRFTKMQGAGNDFIVLDETQGRLGLSPAQYRFLADRHFGVGADQILSVRAPAPQAAAEGIDFEYVIHNADGGEVEQCGNGARCFARFVRDQGLTTKDSIRVQTRAGVIAPRLTADGRVTVDMGLPRFAPEQVPFDASGLTPTPQHQGEKWPLTLDGIAPEAHVSIAIASMGNPHAVLLVDDVDTAPVAAWGPLIEHHARFPARVNAGFLQIVDRAQVRLRVYERGAGETLACGTGACAAVVSGIRLGLLDGLVDVHTRGGRLSIAWAGGASDPVFLTGPATTVFEGQIELPDLL
ncbi:diaminopimelate epimerase [Paenacidovorax caeni]|uniref:Diaminopimelate epimerase n=1 Tax=Paenacidovorax caeni TaxID=343013 RepID=A0A1I7J0U7_9BURK|nr:diaminopimelate epimerase [Paenacidovorax caeni]SFU78800.1 diaminopimelate epimerase [Paenacidovorax caeni]